MTNKVNGMQENRTETLAFLEILLRSFLPYNQFHGSTGGSRGSCAYIAFYNQKKGGKDGLLF